MNTIINGLQLIKMKLENGILISHFIIFSVLEW